MSAKKNLTVAALAALLAVPAFGATNASHALHIPSVTAHADNSNDGGWAALNNAITAHGGHSVRRSDQVDPGNGTVYNGNSIQEYQGGAYVNGQRMSYEQALAYFNGNGTAANGSESGTNNANGTNGANNSNSESNGSTQYASKKSLPQTGESNGNSKAMAMGAIALGASASFMALSIANKHRQESELDSVSSEPTVDDGDGNDDKSNDDSEDDIDTDYHMIMSDMFDNISKDLKQM